MNNRVVRRLKMCGNGFMDEIIILNRFSSTKGIKKINVAYPQDTEKKPLIHNLNNTFIQILKGNMCLKCEFTYKFFPLLDS